MSHLYGEGLFKVEDEAEIAGKKQHLSPATIKFRRKSMQMRHPAMRKSFRSIMTQEQIDDLLNVKEEGS